MPPNVSQPTQGNIVTITAGDGSTFPSGAITTGTLTFRHVNELECFWDGTLCPKSGMQLSSNALQHISLVEVTDESLRSQAGLDAFYPGGYENGINGFTRLLKWMYVDNLPQVIPLGIVIGAPVSYNRPKNSSNATCNSTVLPAAGTLSGGSAVTSDIDTLTANLASAFLSIGGTATVGSSLTVKLDLDEPLNHAYYSFVGSTGGTSNYTGTICQIQTLASLAASILDYYQADWHTLAMNNSSLPQITFLMGDDEAPQDLYNSPTFNNNHDLTSFLNDFYSATGTQSTIPLNGDQRYVNFFLLDIGPTENDWKKAASAVLAQSQLGTGCAQNGTNCPSMGEIFALDHEGPLQNCPAKTYFEDNTFCGTDAAAVAAAQLKIQDLYASTGTYTNLAPTIIRISSYDKVSPAHLLPDADPTTLLSIIDWLYPKDGSPSLALLPPPSTLFKLSNVASGSNAHYYDNSLSNVITLTDGSNPPWIAEYPLGSSYGASVIGNGVVLKQLTRFVCNEGQSYESSYLTLGMTAPNGCSTSGTAIGYAAGPDDLCTLVAAQSADGTVTAKDYSPDCPNVADLPVYQWETVPSVTHKQYYYTMGVKDIFVYNNPNWMMSQTTPVFYLQPPLPRYLDYEPVAFNSGLRTASGANSPVLQLFSSTTSSASFFGFQNTSSGYVLGITGLNGNPVEPLICTGDPRGTSDCVADTKPLPCQSIIGVNIPSLSCGSLANSGIFESQWGNPASPIGTLTCCGSNGPTTLVGLDPVINFYQKSPYLTVYSSNNDFVMAPAATLP